MSKSKASKKIIKKYAATRATATCHWRAHPNGASQPVEYGYYRKRKGRTDRLVGLALYVPNGGVHTVLAAPAENQPTMSWVAVRLDNPYDDNQMCRARVFYPDLQQCKLAVENFPWMEPYED